MLAFPTGQAFLLIGCLWLASLVDVRGADIRIVERNTSSIGETLPIRDFKDLGVCFSLLSFIISLTDAQYAVDVTLGGQSE